ncbi:hypothetical protein L596_006399 [Steinernema carpocapsae]|uniref:Uncharacterized protein n=1 Tax=Steinernema carpocapsae TaxID=34508 RepID=A0A4U8V270_STECR|nr:hypothetical protein L596_006399 [Steinernema carpocapsae]
MLRLLRNASAAHARWIFFFPTFETLRNFDETVGEVLEENHLDTLISTASMKPFDFWEFSTPKTIAESAVWMSQFIAHHNSDIVFEAVHCTNDILRSIDGDRTINDDIRKLVKIENAILDLPEERTYDIRKQWIFISNCREILGFSMRCSPDAYKTVMGSDRYTSLLQKTLDDCKPYFSSQASSIVSEILATFHLYCPRTLHMKLVQEFYAILHLNPIDMDQFLFAERITLVKGGGQTLLEHLGMWSKEKNKDRKKLFAAEYHRQVREKAVKTLREMGVKEPTEFAVDMWINANPVITREEEDIIKRLTEAMADLGKSGGMTREDEEQLQAPSSSKDSALKCLSLISDEVIAQRVAEFIGILSRIVENRTANDGVKVYAIFATRQMLYVLKEDVFKNVSRLARDSIMKLAVQGILDGLGKECGNLLEILLCRDSSFWIGPIILLDENPMIELTATGDKINVTTTLKKPSERQGARPVDSVLREIKVSFNIVEAFFHGRARVLRQQEMEARGEKGFGDHMDPLYSPTLDQVIGALKRGLDLALLRTQPTELTPHQLVSVKFLKVVGCLLSWHTTEDHALCRSLFKFISDENYMIDCTQVIRLVQANCQEEPKVEPIVVAPKKMAKIDNVSFKSRSPTKDDIVKKVVDENFARIAEPPKPVQQSIVRYVRTPNDGGVAKEREQEDGRDEGQNNGEEEGRRQEQSENREEQEQQLQEGYGQQEVNEEMSASIASQMTSSTASGTTISSVESEESAVGPSSPRDRSASFASFNTDMESSFLVESRSLSVYEQNQSSTLPRSRRSLSTHDLTIPGQRRHHDSLSLTTSADKLESTPSMEKIVDNFHRNPSIRAKKPKAKDGRLTQPVIPEEIPGRTATPLVAEDLQDLNVVDAIIRSRNGSFHRPGLDCQHSQNSDSQHGSLEVITMSMASFPDLEDRDIEDTFVRMPPSPTARPDLIPDRPDVENRDSEGHIRSMPSPEALRSLRRNLRVTFNSLDRIDGIPADIDDSFIFAGLSYTAAESPTDSEIGGFPREGSLERHLRKRERELLFGPLEVDVGDSPGPMRRLRSESLTNVFNTDENSGEDAADSGDSEESLIDGHVLGLLRIDDTSSKKEDDDGEENVETEKKSDSNQC